MVGGASLLSVEHGTEIRRRIVAGALSVAQRARVIDALKSRASLSFVDTLDELVAHLRQSIEDVDVIIVPGVDRDGHAPRRVVEEIVAQRPRVAVVAYCPPGSLTDFRALTAAGVHHFIIAGVTDEGIALRTSVETAQRNCAAEWVGRQLAPIVPMRLHRIVEAILGSPDLVTTIPELAEDLGVHRKTLFNWCERAAFLPPEELLCWVRLALVGYLLESTGCTVERIAIELSYPSANALRNTIKRYTGSTASGIRSNGGLAGIITALRGRLESGAPALHRE